MKFLFWFLGLVLATLPLRLLTEPPVDSRYTKLDKSRDSCEVLFVGPSYVVAQIRPKIVDAETTRLGHPVRTCIFGRAGLKGFELHRELDKILDGPWPRLKLVFFDISLGADSSYSQENRFKPRIIRFHDWPVFRWYFKYWEGQRPGDHSHAWWLGDHGLHVVANSLLVGQGAEHLAEHGAVIVPKKKKSNAAKKKKAKTSKKKKSNAAKKKKAKTSKDPPPMSRRANKKRRTRLAHNRRVGRSTTPAPVMMNLLREESSLIEAHNFRAEGLYAPTWSAFALRPEELKGTGLVLHDFADPERYPTLYAWGDHKKDGHLTTLAKEEYSRLLGQLVVERLELSK